MDDHPLIDARALTRRYGALNAVDNLSLRLNQGEVLGLLGPNGAGKSTTMNMLCGTLAANAGQVFIDGVDLARQPRRAKARIGYLPETPPLYPELKIDEFLHFAARLRGVRRPSAALAAAKQRCGLSDMGGRLIGNLSKGFKQRVGIAQAIVHNPAVVVLDEPTVGLDPNQIREIRALIRELGGRHGVLLSTHILPEVQSVCDRVSIIDNGRLVLDQDTTELDHEAETIALRLKHPPDIQEIAGVAGVTHVQPLDAGRFRVHCETGRPVDEALAQAAVLHNWGLAELTPERRSLEEVFVRLTAGDQPGKVA